MKIIESIRIKYFRSILNTTRGNQVYLPTNDLNIIVGCNDAGKSNYLKALSLFFNNYSEPNIAFNFWKDYSLQRHGIRREENRIEIELIINPPLKQNFKNDGKVSWTKVWKEGSISPEESIKYLNGSKFIANNRSAYYKWLKKIRFKYIPAIKSEQYFSDLMYNLYDVLQKDTRSLEQDFNRQIKQKTSIISKQLFSRLNIESLLQFKGTFRDLFNTLEFGSDDGRTMLSQRGDGIKVRHIPIILQSIAEAELGENRKREPIANTIWGFEEPENNLEFISAKKLAESFLEYIKNIHFEDDKHINADEGIQIFLTTHSPVFYTLSNYGRNDINSFLVTKEKDLSSNIRPITSEQSFIIENEMQLQPLIEQSHHWKYVTENLDKIKREKEELKKQLETLGNNHKCIFLTEDSDKNLLNILLESNKFVIADTDVRSYNGCTNIDSARVLHNYLQDKYGNNAPIVIVHRDKDYLSNDEIKKEKEKFEKLGINLFITEGTDIESYFVRIEHLKFCYPAVSVDTLIAFRDQAKLENKESSINALKEKEYGVKHKEKDSHLLKYLPQYYDENSDILFHGKTVYRKVKSLIQKETKQNAKLDLNSELLTDNELTKLSSMIWKQ